MSNPFIKKQLDFIVTTIGLTDIYEIDKIRYGLEIFYGEISKILIMIIFALLLNKLPAFILMITLIVYYICMSFNLGTISIIIALTFSILSSWCSYYFSDKIVLSLNGARLATPEENKKLIEYIGKELETKETLNEDEIDELVSGFDK